MQKYKSVTVKVKLLFRLPSLQSTECADFDLYAVYRRGSAQTRWSSYNWRWESNRTIEVGCKKRKELESTQILVVIEPEPCVLVRWLSRQCDKTDCYRPEFDSYLCTENTSSDVLRLWSDKRMPVSKNGRYCHTVVVGFCHRHSK